MKLRLASWRNELESAIASSTFEDALAVVARNQQQIENGTAKTDLSPWFEIRG
jgi:hypothetical protein